MRIGRTSNSYAKLRSLAAVLTSVIVASAALANLMVTSVAGVRAGITGIVCRQSDNSIGVQFAVRDPTGKNATTFVIQRSTSCTNWMDYSTQSVTGNYPVTGVGSAEISDFVASATLFYPMRLTNF